MTGYTVHTGTSVKFSSGWDSIFAAKKKAADTKKKAGKKKAVGKKSAAQKKPKE